MAEENKERQAREAFNLICEMLDDKSWHYDKNEAEFSIDCKVSGDDLPMALNISVDVERQIVALYSELPFKVNQNKIVEFAVAINAINDSMIDGSFDLNISNGTILFRLTTSVRDSLISKKAFDYMVLVSCSTIDSYNDKLFDLSRGKMTIEELFAFINE